jgi:WD40 repeat protein
VAFTLRNAFLCGINEERFLPFGSALYPDRSPTTLAIAPDGRRVALGDSQGRVRLYDLASRRSVVATQGMQSQVYSLALSADGSRVVTAGMGEKGGLAMLSDVESGRVVTELEEESPVRAVAVTPDDEQFYGATAQGELILCKLTTGERVRRWPALPHPVRALAALPDGRLLVGGDAGMLVLWSPDRGVTAELKGHSGTIRSVAVGGEGEGLRLASAGGDDEKNCSVKLWHADGRLDRTLQGHKKQSNSVAISPDGAWLASGGLDREVLIWNLTEPKKPPSVVARHGQAVRSIVFFPNNRWLASAGGDGVVQIRTVNGDPVKDRWQLPGPVTSLTVDRRGRYLLTGNGNGTVYVLRVPGSQ